MATLSVAPDQAKSTVVVVILLEVSVGAVGACVSGGVKVVMVAVLLSTELFPAASLALTVKL